MFTEATLDFPDEDIDFLRAADARGKLAAIRARLASVLTAARQGALLRDGLAVVLIGEPNVGKSSLINRLCGDDVAIVTPIPGTTRDAIASDIEISGIPLTIIDTAGLRPTDDPDRDARHRAHLGRRAARRPRAGDGRCAPRG